MKESGNNQPKGAGKAPFLFVYGLHDLTEKLQTPGKTIWYRKVCSQAASLDFMVKFQNIISHGQDGLFGVHLDISPEEKTPEIHIFFCHGKRSLRLDTTIDPKKFSKAYLIFPVKSRIIFLCQFGFRHIKIIHLRSLPGKWPSYFSL